jgi:parallel beta-helix repeat protein
MYFLWGFREDPDTMTQTGKDLMLNVVAYLTGVQFIDSIWIDEDADFISYGFPGDGSEANPYLIEKFVISGSAAPLIHIQDTSKHFVIQNNVLDGIDGSYNGTEIWNVAAGTGTISYNTIFNCETGIVLWGVTGIDLNYNWITNNKGDGIFLENSHNNVIEYNTIYNNGPEMPLIDGPTTLYAGSIGHGIYLDPSNDNQIRNNDIGNNMGSGVFLENSAGNTISINAIYENGEPPTESTQRSVLYAGSIGHGIFLDPSPGNTISNNYIADNTDMGIFLEESDGTFVSQNIVENNGANGLLLVNATDNSIDGNYFTENGGAAAESTFARTRSTLYAGSIGHGIFLDPSPGNTISNNLIADNYDVGVFLEDSNGISINGNNIDNNGGNGLFLLDSSGSTIDGNTITQNGYDAATVTRARSTLYAGSIGHGIFLDPSPDNTISNNLIADNYDVGVFLEASDGTNIMAPISAGIILTIMAATAFSS